MQWPLLFRCKWLVTAIQLKAKDLLAIMPEAFLSLQFLDGHQVLPTFVTRNFWQWKDVVDSMQQSSSNPS
jgi:hypothetical protein